MSFSRAATRAIVSGATLSTVMGVSSGFGPNILSVFVYPVSGAGAPGGQVQVFDTVSGMANVNSGTLVYATLSGVNPSPFTQAGIPVNSGIVVQGVASTVVEVLYG